MSGRKKTNVKWKALARRPRPYEDGLGRNQANFQPLTPLTALERAAAVFPGHTAIIHGRQRFTYAQFYTRSRRLASALKARGIKKGDTVAARAAYTRAADINPDYAEAVFGLVIALRKEGKGRDADGVLRRFITHHPANVMARTLLTVDKIPAVEG